MKIRYFLLFSILLIFFAFRLYIYTFLPINGQLNLQILFLGLINIVLLFIIVRKLSNNRVALLTALLYAISPWTAYLEIAASPYFILLAALLVLYLFSQLFNWLKSIFLILAIITIVVVIVRFNLINIFSNVGLLNAVNSFRGETSMTIFAPLGKIIENRYLYFTEHLVFNVMKQFTPATYFTNQVWLLGFSFSPPIYLGFLIPFIYGFIISLSFLSKRNILSLLTFLFLLLPSILAKDSPDLSRLILIAPVIFVIISIGLNKFLLNYKNGICRLLLFLTIFMVVMQILITLTDIAIREPVRLQMFLG